MDKRMPVRLRTVGRRKFMAASVSVAIFTIVPRYVLGGPGYTAPSDKLNIAGIGIGGKGNVDVNSVKSENIVALCDVDLKKGSHTFKQFPKAKVYRDYRVMLEKQKDIDAVMIATPDHTHAIISLAAIGQGKHVYCQKPLTHTVYEARMLAKAAGKAGIATQMGNQGQAGNWVRDLSELVAASD